jgi:hypothetical protein
LTYTENETLDTLEKISILGSFIIVLSTKYDLDDSIKWSRDSAVGIATGWTAGVRLPAGERDFSLLQTSQTGSEVHQPSYLMGARGDFRGGKAERV